MSKKVDVVDFSVEENTEILVQKLKTIQKQKAELEKLDKQIKAQLTDSYFVKANRDNKGNSFYEGNGLILKREARTSIKLNEEKAKKILFELGILDKVLMTIEVIDEDALSQLVMDEAISMDLFEQMCDKSVSYAIKFVPKKETEEEIAT